MPSPAEQQAINAALAGVINKAKAPVALRLVFHDAGTFSAAAGDGGANASIQFELERPENFGLKRGWKLIQQAKAALQGTAAADVSNADLIALCGAKAVAVCGGPNIPVRLGRLDATVADPLDRLPGEQLSAAQLKANFGGKGFTPREFLVLCGAHSIGGKGFGDPVSFDNVYFQALLRKPWTDTKDPMASMIGLPSDHVLPDDPELLPLIQLYADDQPLFFKDFSAAYLKLTELGTGWAA